MDTDTYTSDFYTWTQQQAALLRQGLLAQLDVVNLSAELEGMGVSEHRELENRLTLLLMHLLKWCYQLQRCSKSWRLTIKNQRFQTKRHLQKNPGLKAHLPDAMMAAYYRARLDAAIETELEEATFPEDCPWTMEQIFNTEFWPGDAIC